MIQNLNEFPVFYFQITTLCMVSNDEIELMPDHFKTRF